MNTYEVTIHDYPPRVVSAETASKARYCRWLDFSDTNDCTFREFLSFTRVRKCSAIPDDPYSYVRRAYGVDAKIGQRIELVNEGPCSGTLGEIIYPRQSDQYVHVALERGKRKVIAQVHPQSIKVIEPHHD